MDIQEVCTRLGLKDVSELAGLLDFSDRSHLNILKKMGKEAQIPQYIAEKVVIHADGIKEPVCGNENTASKIRAVRRGWACILSGNQNSPIGQKTKIHVELPKYNPMKLNGQLFFIVDIFWGMSFILF